MANIYGVKLRASITVFSYNLRANKSYNKCLNGDICTIQSKASHYTHFYYSAFKETTHCPSSRSVHIITKVYIIDLHGHTSLLQFGNITPDNQQPDIGMLPTQPHVLCWSQLCGWKCEAFQYPDADCSEYYSRMVGVSCFHDCDSDLCIILSVIIIIFIIILSLNAFYYNIFFPILCHLLLPYRICRTWLEPKCVVFFLCRWVTARAPAAKRPRRDIDLGWVSLSSSHLDVVLMLWVVVIVGCYCTWWCWYVLSL